MARIDIHTPAHKALRAQLFATAQLVVRSDFADTAQTSAVGAAWGRLAAQLDGHARRVDEHVVPLLDVSAARNVRATTDAGLATSSQTGARSSRPTVTDTTPASLARILRQALRHASALGLALAALVWIPAGCGVSADTIPDTVPARLADTGLYADFAARTLASDVLAYEPQYPLWTDGAAKRRWIRLPPGTTIDAANPDVWSFPVGTRLWKEFALGRRIETRYMLRRRDGSWLHAAYAWSTNGTEAVLAPEEGVRAACESAPGVPYDVPARADCGACHAAGPNAVLGFSALQLSGDRDPLAPHAREPESGSVDLAELVRRGLVRNLPQRLVDEPPRIAAADPIERAALGYLHGNCGMCHTDSGQLAGLDLDLWTSLAGGPDDDARRTTVDHSSRFRSGTPAKSAVSTEPVRVAPGDPDASVLLHRMRSRQPLSQMPPLGTHVRDDEAVELLTNWIRSQSAHTPPTWVGSTARSPVLSRSQRPR